MGSTTKTPTHGSTLQQIKSAKKRAGWQGDPQRRVHELSQKNGDYLFVKFKKIQNEGWEDTPGALANPSQKICTETQFTAMPTKARQLMNFEKGESGWAAVARVLDVLDRKCWLCDLGSFLSPFPFRSNSLKIMQHGVRICQELLADSHLGPSIRWYHCHAPNLVILISATVYLDYMITFDFLTSLEAIGPKNHVEYVTFESFQSLDRNW